MLPKFFPLLAISLWGVVVLPWSQPVNAATPLTRAEIRDLRNLVQLIPKNSPKRRPARKLDPMTPGDGLSTGRASLADLRFNDGSLARVGEQAIFRFLPKTRNFRLSNGTVLLLIPPGRGQTRIHTPNAAAAIRGSALFVRYDEATDTTIVGALTNSGIEVSNKHSQGRVLEAGQLMVIVKDKIQGLYDFDLRTFYETSDLVRGLDLTRQNLAPTPDPAIASVQAETSAALATQTPIAKGDGVLENPSFLQLTATSSSEAESSASNDDENTSTSSSNQEEASVNPSQENLNVDSLVDTGEVQVTGQLGNNTNNTNNNSINIPQQPQPNNNPGNNTGNNPGNNTGNDPGNNTNNNPGNNTGNNPGNNTGNDPGNNTGNDPGNNTGNNPGNNTGNDPGNNTGNNPGNNTGNDPGNNTGNDPGNNTGNNPGNNTGNDPGNNTGNNPGNNTGNDPGNNTGNNPGNNTGNDPGNNTGNNPGNNTGNDPGNNTGNDPGNNTGNDPGNNTGNDPGNNTGNGGQPDLPEDDRPST
ncbi:FecR family protein [Calothrix anomala]|uniref:FecR domain-containing protein n=1 Tax=Calothrix anomala FACHB-343 TaxID=2692894 RepID=A0ABR8AS69_9CYAN|nr:FecR family protein [Calothrix anomala]MBD2224040.1 FecR domain-containing protein [Calothrix anomala FACHB-343]